MIRDVMELIDLWNSIVKKKSLTLFFLTTIIVILFYIQVKPCPISKW